MIDIELLRTQPELVRNAIRVRGMQLDLDRLLSIDRRWRELMAELGKLRHERNVAAAKISKTAGREGEEYIKRVKEVLEKIKKLETELEKIENERDRLLAYVPNIPHESVPVGDSEDFNVVIRKVGSIPRFSFKPKDHVELGLALDLIDIERAAKVSGARFYYLKNDAVKLEFALVCFGLELMQKEGFTLVIPPSIVKEKAMFGTGFIPFGNEDIYRIEGKELCLAGTAEVPLGAMHMNEIFDARELPKYYAGFSSCFRTEAGAHGKDTKGIFRTHQFDKLEMFKFTLPEESWKEHEKLLASAEKIYTELRLPYRVVNVCTGELGAPAAKKYDIEVWFPGQNRYREIVSCSNCTDYQARRLNIRYRARDGKHIFVHTLNSTAIAIGRTIVAIMENYQQEDGSILVPEVLQRYAGLKKISL